MDMTHVFFVGAKEVFFVDYDQNSNMVSDLENSDHRPEKLRPSGCLENSDMKKKTNFHSSCLWGIVQDLNYLVYHLVK